MQKNIIIYVIILVVIIVIFYLETGFKLPASHNTTTMGGASTTTTSGTGNYMNSTTTIGQLYSCSSFEILEAGFNKTDVERCLWTGGSFGVWVAAGNSSNEHLTIVGNNGSTYVNQSSSHNCTTFYTNLTAPAQIYTITFATGPGGGRCGVALVKFNSTTTPPNVTYNYVYNGNFSNGEFSGWTATGKGFGTAPLNITHANNIGCYIGAPWDTFNGTVSFAASTYHCGTAAAPGNLTSSLFTVSRPFLNFQVISPQMADLYVEILYNGKPYIIAHYNTYNSSLGGNPPTTFRNASIPMTSLAGKAVRIRVVADTLQSQKFISVTGFQLSKTPIQKQGITTNMTIYNTT